jgi:hypothetical protein
MNLYIWVPWGSGCSHSLRGISRESIFDIYSTGFKTLDDMRQMTTTPDKYKNNKRHREKGVPAKLQAQITLARNIPGKVGY